MSLVIHSKYKFVICHFIIPLVERMSFRADSLHMHRPMVILYIYYLFNASPKVKNVKDYAEK